MKKIISLFCLCFLFCGIAWGYSSPNVPVENHVYRDLDKLIGAGLIKDSIYGQRPWSRYEIARMIKTALKNWDSQGGPVAPDARDVFFLSGIDGVLMRLKEEYRDELADENFLFRPLDEAEIKETILNSPPTSLPVANGLGQIQADVNPFTGFQEGRHFADGNTFAIETSHATTLTPYFSLYARPRFEVLSPRTGFHDTKFLAQKLYGKLAYKKWTLQVGRDSLVWGQGENGGFILSNNARPLDAIQLGTQSPVFLPSFLKYLGPNSFKIFFANLGTEREFPHAILTGYKWSLKPVDFLELGLNHVVMMGGDGATGPSPLASIGEFSGFLSALCGNKCGNATTDRIFSVESRLTVAALNNTVFYGEVGFDDTKNNLSVLFKTEASYYAGIYFPHLNETGTTDLRLEFKHTSPLLYRHVPYISGVTLNRRILGDELGPNGNEVSAKLRVDVSENSLLTTRVSYETRDSDHYLDTGDINKDQTGIAEKRMRFEAGVTRRLRRQLSLGVKADYERVLDIGFTEGSNKNNWLGSLSLTYRP